MKLILRNKVNKFIKSISFEDFENYQNVIDQLLPQEKPIKATLLTSDKRIYSHELLKFKNTLESLKINFIEIYSDNRETIITGNSLKINSILINKNEAKIEFFANFSFRQKDIFHKGTVRSGNRISSNGDLFVMGDVNPGAIVSANNNVYVWGKLLGIALAGENGDENASISSLYLNPLQLRICNVIAIGPQEKPNHQYPEVAVLEENRIIIKPYIIPR